MSTSINPPSGGNRNTEFPDGLPSVRVAVVGRGRVGFGLHEVWQKTLSTCHLPGRTEAIPSECDAIVLAVSDAAVMEVARRLVPHASASVSFFHCAGALPADYLGGLGVSYGAIHPLISFAPAGEETRVKGGAFSVGGDEVAIVRARSLVEAAGGFVLGEPGSLHGAGYHAGAALCANGAAALGARGVAILERHGVSSRQAEYAIAALLRSVADRIHAQGFPAALTGPVARGDTATVKRHRDALSADERADYDAIGPLIVRLASSGGELSEVQLKALSRIFGS